MRQVFRFPFPVLSVGWRVTSFLQGFLRFGLLVCLLLCAGGGDAGADVNRPPTAPVPVAVPGKAVAVRGFPVEIRLEGKTGTVRSLEFVIRRGPRQGRLEGPPVQTTKDSAVVKYVADPASTAEADSFTFSTKIEGIGTSLEAEVAIRLVDPAPVLEAPGGVDMGRILAAEVIPKTITITNKGNAPWNAVVPLPAGWSWLAPPGGQFNLAPGDRTEATVRVRVAEPGEVDEKVVLRPGTVVRFIGRATPPFLAYPSLLRLQWDRAKKQRAWKMTVRNNRGEPMTVRLSGPVGLVVPESLTIPIAESKDVPVAWTGSLSKAAAGAIRLEAPGWRQEVNFETPAAPAAVDVLGAGPDGTVDFGVLEKADGSKAVKTLTIKNVGGTASVIRWDPLRLFVLEGLDAETVLPPDAERQLTLRPRPDEPGRLKEELLLRMTGGDRLLKLVAEIDPAAAKEALMQGKVLDVKPVPAHSSSAIEAPRAVSGDGLRLRTKILSGGLMEAFPNQDPNHPAVDDVRLIEAETTSERLVFEWNAPGLGTWKYHVMVKVLRNHGLQQAPIPEYGEMPNVKVMSTPTGGRAEVTGLRPEVYWKCRIVSVRNDGVSTKAGRELTFITPPLRESNWGWRLIGVLGAVSLVLYVRQKWREDVQWKD